MLTESQLQAVNSDAHELLLIAGAGSGKTQVVAERVARLIRDGSPPDSILCLTFTRAAARNMRDRIATLADPAVAKRVPVGTFHHHCLKLLQIYGDRLGYDPATLEVLNPVDADSILLEAARDLQYLDDRGDRKKWKAGLSQDRLKRAVERAYRESDPVLSDVEARIVAEYRSQLKRNNCVDFGAILAETNRLLDGHGDVLARYHARYTAVVCDELQDCDEINYRLHDWFAPPADFCGVGDFRQSVYGFRGARPGLWKARRPNATILSLADNFRCRAAIVDVSNRLIQHNPEGRECEPMRAVKEGGAVRVFHGRSEDIAAKVLEYIYSTNYSPGEIAVIARSHRELGRLSEVFAGHHIPHRHVGRKFDITTTDEFLDLHAAMRLAANPRDDHAFRRLVPRLGIEREQMTAIRRIAAEKGCGLWNAACEWCEGEWGENSLGVALAWSDWTGVSFADAMLRLWDAFEIIDPRIMHFWEEECAGMTLAEALQWYACRDEQDDVPEPDDNVVTLLTSHACKGLQWPVVLMANLNQGSWPTSSAIREGGIEEERRTAFVAATRAEDVLLLHYRTEADQSEDGKISEPSQFLTEMGLTL